MMMDQRGAGEAMQGVPPFEVAVTNLVGIAEREQSEGLDLLGVMNETATLAPELLRRHVTIDQVQHELEQRAGDRGINATETSRAFRAFAQVAALPLSLRENAVFDLTARGYVGERHGGVKPEEFSQYVKQIDKSRKKLGMPTGFSGRVRETAQLYLDVATLIVEEQSQGLLDKAEDSLQRVNQSLKDKIDNA